MATVAATILWLTLAVAAGWAAGRAIGRWSNVSGWLNRVLEDPPGPGDARQDDTTGDRLHQPLR